MALPTEVQPYVRSRSYYAPTNGGSAISISVDVRSGGNGSIYFGAVPSPWSRYQTWPQSFENIANVSDVYELCCELQEHS